MSWHEAWSSPRLVSTRFRSAVFSDTPLFLTYLPLTIGRCPNGGLPEEVRGRFADQVRPPYGWPALSHLTDSDSLTGFGKGFINGHSPGLVKILQYRRIPGKKIPPFVLQTWRNPYFTIKKEREPSKLHDIFTRPLPSPDFALFIPSSIIAIYFSTDTLSPVSSFYQFFL